MSLPSDEGLGRRGEWLRWGICFAVIVAAHGFAAFMLLNDASAASDFDPGAPAVLLELPEIAAAPAVAPNDIAPGPQQPESDPSPETDPSPQTEQQTPPEPQPRPPEEPAEVALPVAEPPKPQPPAEERPPTATPSVELPLAQDAPPTPGAEVVATRRTEQRWRSELAAHIERFKRYPSEARVRGEQGLARVAFTIDHQGHLLSSHIVQSSGSSALDHETLAMLERAQPMPRPPEQMSDAELSFVVPVRFNIR